MTKIFTLAYDTITNAGDGTRMGVQRVSKQEHGERLQALSRRILATDYERVIHDDRFDHDSGYWVQAGMAVREVEHYATGITKHFETNPHAFPEALVPAGFMMLVDQVECLLNALDAGKSFADAKQDFEGGA